ncbi:hypothetical protein CVT24_004076 [Panaeolus cyanescens]|uniref:Aromatic-L-amino-acid decarboxylase n=1 Tax=Panaeolus cyanescens TaxID=181874 RepID=A0A409Y5T5_9AGAR|nr:hypothetical protein CVT24_004076 [Panaeolus cyanescens]
MDIEQFRKAGYQAIDRICDYYYSLQNRPVVPQVEPGYLRKHITATSLPEEGEDFQIIADDYQKFILPGLTHWQHPSFFAYFPTACTFEGMLGDLYASSATNPGFNWLASPACTELETIVIDWAADLLGLASEFKNDSGIGGGVFQTTASDSVLVVVAAARSLYLSRHPQAKIEELVIYTTTQTHSVGAKAGIVYGIKVRAIPVNMEDGLALRASALRKAIEEDEAAGLRPFILIASVGTTSSGAIDCIPEIREVVKDHPDLWVHIDAAWAGVALACPETRETMFLDDINAFANSFCTNFHKCYVVFQWGLVNFDCSALWVRNRRHLTDALDITPAYLRTKHGDEGKVIDYRNWHLGLGRRFRSLKVWFVLRSYGAEGFRKYIRECITHNNTFASLIRASNRLQLVTEPSFALTVFRLVPPSRSVPAVSPADSGVDLSAISSSGITSEYDLEALNDLNKDYMSRLAARSDIMLTQTTLNGIYCIRFAVGAARTKDEHVRRAWEVVEEEAEKALEAWNATKA